MAASAGAQAFPGKVDPGFPIMKCESSDIRTVGRASEPGHDLAVDGAGVTAEFRDHKPLLARHRDVIDAGAAGALAFHRLLYQPVAAAGGIDEGDGAVLRHRALV